MWCISRSWLQFSLYLGDLKYFYYFRVYYCEPGLKSPFLIHVSDSFCLLLLDIASCRIGILSSTIFILETLFFHFSLFAFAYKKISLLTYLCFFSLIYLFCFYPWPYTLIYQTVVCSTANIFSIVFQVFRNSFWQICPLFGQILITHLKYSKDSFSPSSYSKKMQ